MKTIKHFLVIIILLLLYPFCVDQEVDQESDERQILIYTVPSDLKVYLAPLDSNKTSFSSLEEGYIKIHDKENDKHYLINKKNLKGRSPIVQDSMKAGTYIVGVEPVEFFDKHWAWQNIDPFLQNVAYVSSWPLENSEMRREFEWGKIKQEGAIIYMFEKEKDEKKIVIIHAKDSISLDDLNSHYPSDLNFAFDSLKLTSELEEKNILNLFTENELSITMDLLHRGGKAIVERAAGDIRILIEIVNDTNFKIEIFRRKQE